MERAQVQLKNELESSAKSQLDLAQLLRQQEATAGEFAQKRDSLRKAVRPLRSSTARLEKDSLLTSL